MWERGSIHLLNESLDNCFCKNFDTFEGGNITLKNIAIMICEFGKDHKGVDEGLTFGRQREGDGVKDKKLSFKRAGS